MGSRIRSHMRSNLVAYLALFVALGGVAYAAGHINGKSIKKGSTPGNRLKKASTPGNRLKKDTVTGKQVKESSLAKVPSAKTADRANNADRATNADNATTATNALALGGTPPSGYGQGIINGGIDSPQNGGTFRTPYGVTLNAAPGAGLEAVAPVAMNIRDFEAQWITNFDSDDTLAFSVQINNGSSLVSVPLCTIVGTAAGLDCRAAGPIPIARGDLYKLDLTGAGLEGNEQATFAYRAPAG